MNTHTKSAISSVLSVAESTPKRPRVGGPSSASRPSSNAFSSSPSQYSTNTNTPVSRSAGPSRLNASSPAGLPNGSSPSTSAPFHERTNKLAVQDILNPELDLPTSSQRSGSNVRVVLASNTDPRMYNYRIAYERPMERSEALDTMIDDAAETFRDLYNIEEFGDPSVQSQEDIIAVGRLCPETDTAKMTETSIWLESSRSLGSGSRVMLKFDPDVKVRGGPSGGGGHGMFPGCLVAVKGRNGGGKMFTAHEIIMMPPGDITYTEPSKLLSQQHGTDKKQLGGNPLSVIVAAGPYTVDSDLEYEPLGALLEMVEGERPDVLVLLGPFVDSDHPLIKVGDVTQTPAEIFKSQISSRLSTLMIGSPRTSVILIPNQRDLTSVHVAYPQSPFAKDAELGLPKGVKLLPNPTSFSVNEVSFAITSVDVLFAVRNSEYFHKCPDVATDSQGDVSMDEDPSAKDLMARTCRHLLRQRSFYPVFPAPTPTKMIKPLNLDMTHVNLLKMATAGADIVIVPSMLKHFTRIVDSTVMINPSYLTRGNNSGTFARLTIHPMDKGELEQLATQGGDEPIEHRVWERCRVDTIKI